jgi:hypothetical protein
LLLEGREIAAYNNINTIEQIKKIKKNSFEKSLYSHASNDSLCSYTHEPSSHVVVSAGQYKTYGFHPPPLFDIISARHGKELVYFQDHPRGRA